METNETNTDRGTWTCSAGPRQSKGVKRAASELDRTIRESVELSGVKGEPEGPYDRTIYWSPFSGPINARAVELWSSIGSRFRWEITRENYKEVEAAILAALPEARAARPVVDKRREPGEEKAKLEASAAREAKAKAEGEARDAAARAILARRPAGAAALIVAELDEDTSESMSDYFAHVTKRRVAIGWRTGSREDFRQLRRAAAGFPETAHLEPDAPDEVEHRENYSMGGGNYLKAGGSHSSGWRVVSESIGSDGTLKTWGAVLEDGLPSGTLPDPSRTCSSAGFLAPRTDSPDGLKPGTPSGSFRIQASSNRRGPFWLVVLADRVERPEFERLRSSATSAGGWYSRAFGRAPGGFGFSSEAAALVWTAGEFPAPAANVGTPAQVPTVPNAGLEPGAPRPGGEHAPTTEDGTLPDPRGPRPLEDRPTDSFDGLEPGTRLNFEEDSRMMEAGRLYALADKVADEVERKRAPLTQNWTARRARIKDGQRASADRLERVERGLRAMARALRENRLPGTLASSLTRAGVERLVARQDRTLAELVTAHEDEGTRAADEARAKAEAIRKAEDEFRCSSTPGFFPTPDAVAERLFELLEVEPGMTLLEPSAGLGHLAERARTAGADVTCCESNARLADVLRAKGFGTICGDFLQQAHGLLLETFDRVAMNPPFERGEDYEHVRAAVRCLKPGGRLVAVVTPRTAELLQRMYGATVEPLPEGSFQGAGAFRSTGVRCSLVTIERGNDT